MYDFETIRTYGKAKKYRIDKVTIRWFISFLLVVIPFVTPLMAFVPRVIKKDLFIIVRR